MEYGTHVYSIKLTLKSMVALIPLVNETPIMTSDALIINGSMCVCVVYILLRYHRHNNIIGVH